MLIIALAKAILKANSLVYYKYIFIDILFIDTMINIFFSQIVNSNLYDYKTIYFLSLFTFYKETYINCSII